MCRYDYCDGVCYIVSVFFFFKQKTAYEMRISGWSSDVCSSDLQVNRSPRAEQLDDAPAAEPPPVREPEGGDVEPLGGGEVIHVDVDQQVHTGSPASHVRPTTPAATARLQGHQIGRGSARESESTDALRPVEPSILKLQKRH